MKGSTAKDGHDPSLAVLIFYFDMIFFIILNQYGMREGQRRAVKESTAL